MRRASEDLKQKAARLWPAAHVTQVTGECPVAGAHVQLVVSFEGRFHAGFLPRCALYPSGLGGPSFAEALRSADGRATRRAGKLLLRASERGVAHRRRAALVGELRRSPLDAVVAALRATADRRAKERVANMLWEEATFNFFRAKETRSERDERRFAWVAVVVTLAHDGEAMERARRLEEKKLRRMERALAERNRAWILGRVEEKRSRPPSFFDVVREGERRRTLAMMESLASWNCPPRRTVLRPFTPPPERACDDEESPGLECID